MHPIFPVSVCEPEGTQVLVHYFLLTFGFFPYKAFVFSAGAALLDNSPLMIISSLIFSTIGFSLLMFVSSIIGMERPAEFDRELCQVTTYAMPDPTFTACMVYTFVLSIGVYQQKSLRRPVSWWRASRLAIFVLGYFATTLISHYFAWWQLVGNIVVSAVLALVYWRVYEATRNLVWRDASESMRRHVESVARILGAKVRRSRRRRN